MLLTSVGLFTLQNLEDPSPLFIPLVDAQLYHIYPSKDLPAIRKILRNGTVIMKKAEQLPLLVVKYPGGKPLAMILSSSTERDDWETAIANV